MINLKIISSTVRPGRKGPAVARWMVERANATGLFTTELLDLGEINLPLMNEPEHPVKKQYRHEHTKAWSAKIGDADAFIFVTAEYNYSYPAPLKNALEYLVHEWAYKPAGIVSYSAGAFGGVRAAMSLKTDLLSLRCIALAEQVNLPLVDGLIDEAGMLTPNEQGVKASATLLGQLVRWHKGLKLIREDQ